jgi:hypothetical protein
MPRGSFHSQRPSTHAADRPHGRRIPGRACARHRRAARAGAARQAAAPSQRPLAAAPPPPGLVQVVAEPVPIATRPPHVGMSGVAAALAAGAAVAALARFATADANLGLLLRCARPRARPLSGASARPRSPPAAAGRARRSLARHAPAAAAFPRPRRPPARFPTPHRAKGPPPPRRVRRQGGVDHGRVAGAGRGAGPVPGVPGGAPGAVVAEPREAAGAAPGARGALCTSAGQGARATPCAAAGLCTRVSRLRVSTCVSVRVRVCSGGGGACGSMRVCV